MKKVHLVIVGIMIMFAFVLFTQTSVNAKDAEGNMVIVLDPGHGGGDPGASNSTYGLQEAKVNYQIATYAKSELEKYEGVKVFLTRYADCPTIKERAEFAQKYNADLLVSLHINSGNSSWRGAEIWVTQDKTKAEYYEQSKQVGDKILSKLQNLGIPNRGVSTRSGKADEWYPSGVVKDYYGIIRYAMDFNIRSILVEHCFISNSEDCKFINSNEKLQKIGIADATGIAEAYKLTKKGAVSVKEIKLDKEKVNLTINEKTTLKVTFNPTNASNKTVTWESSNPDVVRVWGGDIRGLKEGTSIITATTQNGNKKATCEVTVTKEKVANTSSNTTNTTNTVANTVSNNTVANTTSNTTTNTTNTDTVTNRAGSEIPFKDVEKGIWYYDAVKLMYNKKIIQGYDSTHFAPNDKLTRGQLVTILWRMDGSKSQANEKNKFSDVGNNLYYTDAIKWASVKKIVTGYGGTTKFGPEDPITRQDLAVILNRYAEYTKKKSTSTASLTKFKDYKTVAGYAENAVKWAVENEIITGNTLKDGTKTIAPQANATRAEVATMLARYINKFENNSKEN